MVKRGGRLEGRPPAICSRLPERESNGREALCGPAWMLAPERSEQHEHRKDDDRDRDENDKCDRELLEARGRSLPRRRRSLVWVGRAPEALGVPRACGPGR